MAKCWNRDCRTRSVQAPPCSRRISVTTIMASTNPLLEARDLHAYYGASHVLHGVDFHVNEGEAVGLMGRNGMGKTTLLKSLLGLVPPRGGDVRLRGASVTGTAPWRVARSGIAYVPEGRGI